MACNSLYSHVKHLEPTVYRSYLCKLVYHVFIRNLPTYGFQSITAECVLNSEYNGALWYSIMCKCKNATAIDGLNEFFWFQELFLCICWVMFQTNSNTDDFGGGRNTLAGEFADVQTIVKDKHLARERKSVRAQQRDINHQFKETLKNIQECGTDTDTGK